MDLMKMGTKRDGDIFLVSEMLSNIIFGWIGSHTFKQA
jgi:hypothetical protein